MLLLGAVALFEPVNGYQIRRELLSWQVDRWAHTNPGSIYHGLSSLAGQGFLARHDLVDGVREVAVYELTDDGRAELRRLMIEALETVNPYERSGFTVAFSMLPLLDRAEVVRSLTARRVELERTVAEFGNAEPGVAPPHATRAMLLWLDLAVAELAWLRETIEDVRDGQLAFAPGDNGWTPPDDDPGWQMSADRERYRALLGR
ncbi:PadR family transcriptional regulator [Nocardioides sp. MAH-18]|uniref:PadR family transcriptional regulator n=2 Tax=Nocardioidaceae TaxID=85015 RepID=A0A6L6XSI8_9ACTN|nr:PadR family transcriptional regulator [Nocardioides sp. CGMCC 1.13656]MVQ49978.1 PadR family transcriptional regulator [Nocardioides sp. MAH-18]